MPAERQWRPTGRRWLAPGLLVIAGCSTWVDVRPLATGRTEVEAFELLGPDLAVLRREAVRRCPQGAEVLRQAARDQQAAAEEDGRIARWMNRTAAWFDPPQRTAQMVVVCKPNPANTALAAATKPAQAASAAESSVLAGAADSASAEAPPIGPITPQW